MTPPDQAKLLLIQSRAPKISVPTLISVGPSVIAGGIL